MEGRRGRRPPAAGGVSSGVNSGVSDRISSSVSSRVSSAIDSSVSSEISSRVGTGVSSDIISDVSGSISSCVSSGVSSCASNGVGSEVSKVSSPVTSGLTDGAIRRIPGGVTSGAAVALFLLIGILLTGGHAAVSPGGPQFVEEHSGNVTARVNGSVILNCRVRRMASRQVVSWGRGFQVLTGGLMLFAGDRRFQPLHQEYSEDWGLRILSVRLEDAGWYFCQVSTSPPMSHYLYLTVVEPEVEILGGPDLYINKGSTANLTCVIRRAHKVPENVRWTHDNKLVQFDRSRAGIRVRTSHELRRTVSSVLIERALPSDSGQYFCDPDGLHQAKVTVHVLDGEYPAAMQTSEASPVAHQTASLLIFVGVMTSRLLAA